MHAWTTAPLRRRRGAWIIVAAVGTLLSAACTVGGGGSGQIVGLGPGPGVDPGMIPCGDAARFTFVGETSLAALGLADEFGRGPDMQRPGLVWVTADGINPREVCVQWPDGSGMGGTIADDWRPPGELAARGDAGNGAGTPPLGPLVLLAVLALIAGVSYLAFRGERS